MQFFAASLLAFAAVAFAQGAAPQGGADAEPCPPQFKLQCCQHVISAPDAALFKITVDPKANPGLAGTSCKFMLRYPERRRNPIADIPCVQVLLSPLPASALLTPSAARTSSLLSALLAFPHKRV